MVRRSVVKSVQNVQQSGSSSSTMYAATQSSSTPQRSSAGSSSVRRVYDLGLENNPLPCTNTEGHVLPIDLKRSGTPQDLKRDSFNFGVVRKYQQWVSIPLNQDMHQSSMRVEEDVHLQWRMTATSIVPMKTKIMAGQLANIIVLSNLLVRRPPHT